MESEGDRSQILFDVEYRDKWKQKNLLTLY